MLYLEEKIRPDQQDRLDNAAFSRKAPRRRREIPDSPVNPVQIILIKIECIPSYLTEIDGTYL
jgi:hypothetical protein